MWDKHIINLLDETKLFQLNYVHASKYQMFGGKALNIIYVSSNDYYMCIWIKKGFGSEPSRE